MNNFFEEDVYMNEEDYQDYTREEIDMLIAKYDIDLEEANGEADEFSPLLQRHKRK